MSLVLDGVQDVLVPAGCKLVLVAIADRAQAGDEGRAWPSIADLAKRTGFTARHVQNHLRTAVERGWIERQVRGGRTNTNIYRLNIERMESIQKGCTPVQGNGEKGEGQCMVTAERLQSGAEKDAIGGSKGRNLAQERVHSSAPELLELTSTGLNRHVGADAGERETAQPQTVLKKIEPGTARPHMTREEQIAAVQKLARQQRERKASR
jgi:hypothetical protein